MDYKTTGNIKGNTITLENEVPIRGRVTVIIHQDEDIISQELILSFLKEKLPEWKDLFNVEKIGIFGSFARAEQTSDSDIDVIVKFCDNPKNIFNSKNKIRESIEERFKKKVDLANELYLKPHIREQILKEAIYVAE
ncbi:MAG: nucleotidyltransferase family protein [Leptospiraceae bacterium]|nr:nucleotidyltransferase family protein [Leptospiraceae bacterium]